MKFFQKKITIYLNVIMSSSFSEVEFGVAEGHIDFNLDEFGAAWDDRGWDQRSNIPLVDFAWLMSGEWVMVAGSESLIVIIIDSH